jgi:hypothetical protein
MVDLLPLKSLESKVISSVKTFCESHVPLKLMPCAIATLASSNDETEPSLNLRLSSTLRACTGH